MAHLAAHARLLAVVVPVATGPAQHGVGIRYLPDPVEHAGLAAHGSGSQRPAEHCPQVVFELRGLGTFDGPVPGVVHPRGDLVGQQFVAPAEQLQCHHPHVIEALGDRARMPAGSQGKCRLDPGRCQAGGQHAIDMPVLGDRPGIEAAVAPAHRQHRQLAIKGHQRLDDQPHAAGLGAQRLPGRVGVGRRHDPVLALAVVAQAAGL